MKTVNSFTNDLIKCPNEFTFPVNKEKEAGLFWFCAVCHHKYKCATGDYNLFKYYGSLHFPVSEYDKKEDKWKTTK